MVSIYIFVNCTLLMIIVYDEVARMNLTFYKEYALYGFSLLFLSAGCYSANESSSNIAEFFQKFPTWIGTFLGVLWGAKLAYELNRKKQGIDDAKAEFEKDRDSYYRFVSIYGTAVRNLSIIKRLYFKDNYTNQIDFSLNVRHQFGVEYENIDFDMTQLNFIDDLNDSTRDSFNSIAELFDAHNNIIKKFNHRNILRKEYELSFYKYKRKLWSTKSVKKVNNIRELDSSFFEFFSELELFEIFNIDRQLLIDLNEISPTIDSYEENLEIFIEYFKVEREKFTKKPKFSPIRMIRNTENISLVSIDPPSQNEVREQINQLIKTIYQNV